MKIEYVKAVENNDMIADPTERFIVKVNDFLHSIGLWYTLLGQKIIPFFIYLIPINVVIGRFNRLVNAVFPGINLNGPIMVVMWVITMIGFGAVTIMAPKAATVVEFVFGSIYLFLALRYHLFHNALGYSILIGMIAFLLVKLVFLVFKIIRLRAFADDKKNNIERDASGRIVRAASDEVVFTKEDKTIENEKAVPVSYDEVYYVKEDNNNNEPIIQTDDQVVFAGKDEYADNIGTISESDNDYFFG